MKKINLKSISEPLSNKELMQFKGGWDPDTGGSRQQEDYYICWMVKNGVICCDLGTQLQKDCFDWGMANCPWGFACGPESYIKYCPDEDRCYN